MTSVKGAVSPVFSITVMIQKRHVYRWESKNCGLVLLTWLFYRTDRNRAWLRMPDQEGDHSGLQLETYGRFFQVSARDSDEIGKN